MKLYNVEVEDIKTWDYPDFVDAFISYAENKYGEPLTKIELELINEDTSLVYDYVINKLY